MHGPFSDLLRLPQPFQQRAWIIGVAQGGLAHPGHHAELEESVDDFNVASWEVQLEGAKTGRELPAIVDEIITMTWIDFGDRKPVRAFVCTPNAWGYPAKDRSGRLEQLEPPNLGALIAKLTSPGQRKPFTVVSPGQPAQT